MKQTIENDMMKSLTQKNILDDLTCRLRQLNETTGTHFGPMTVHELICHCSDALRVSLGITKAENRSNWFHRSLKKPVLQNWIPDWWLHVLSLWFFNIPEIDQTKKGTRPVDFEADRDELIRLMHHLADPSMKNHIGIHPHLGPLNYEELNRINYLHIDYHIRQCKLEETNQINLQSEIS